MHKMIAWSRRPRGDEESNDPRSCSSCVALRWRTSSDRRRGTIGTASSSRSCRSPAARENRKKARNAVAAPATVADAYRSAKEPT